MILRLLLTLILFCQFIDVKAQAPSRTSWFEEAKFGMFIHWGLYSAAEGMWKGENLRYLNNYAEWIRYRNRISKEEYGKLANRFDWHSINPEEWVLLAKEAGMKYIIMTSKHHDGVALWDTKIGEYSLPKLANNDRDIIKELADACRKHNMKLGFYYSHWIDWEHPYAWDHNLELTKKVSDKQFDQYWQEKAIPQLRELLTNYGDIAMMWFDMWIPYQKTIFKKGQLEQAVALIRELQPNCLINSRLGLPTDAKYVDFQTLGDNVFSSNFIDHPWETPGTIAHSWGFNSQEQEWKSTSQLFKSLVSNVSLNGGYTLNIGPRADGSVPFESITRLKEIGIWLNNYGEAVYNNTGLKLGVNHHDWGHITRDKMENNVYLHVFNWPLDKILRVSGIKSIPTKIELLSKDGASTLSYTQHGPLLHINVPQHAPEHYNSIIKITYNTVEIEPDLVAESSFGGMALHALNVLNLEKHDLVRYDGFRPNFIKTNQNKLSWLVYFAEKGDYSIDLSAHNPSTESVPINISNNLVNIKSTIAPNGMIVAEPNENNYTEEFVDNPIGTIRINEPGYQTITINKLNTNDLYFNRLWIIKKDAN